MVYTIVVRALPFIPIPISNSTPTQLNSKSFTPPTQPRMQC